MPGQNIGYMRVSTGSQNVDRQLAGIDLHKTFIDKATGSNDDRPQLDAMLSHVREGDTLHLHSIDRLARNLQDLLSLIETITGKGVTVVFHKENLTFNGIDDAMGQMMLSLMGAIAQFERSLINERASEGRKIAMDKGVRFGRPSKLTAKQIAEIRREYAGGKSQRALSIDHDCSRGVIARALKDSVSEGATQ